MHEFIKNSRSCSAYQFTDCLRVVRENDSCDHSWDAGVICGKKCELDSIIGL